MNKKKFTINSPLDISLVLDYLFINNTNKPYLVLALEGDLGVGKTTFVKHLGLFLGTKENINSPTFNILKTYILPKTISGFKRLLHVDAYRLSNKKEIVPLKLKEAIIESGTISCLEWPNILSDILPKDTIRLKIEIIPKTETRKITIFIPEV